MNDFNPTTIFQLTYGDLKRIVDEIIISTQNAMLAGRAYEREQPTLTRKQVAERLNVSISTLQNWDKSGFLVPVRIGTKVLYRESDILKMLNRKK